MIVAGFSHNWRIRLQNPAYRSCASPILYGPASRKRGGAFLNEFSKKCPTLFGSSAQKKTELKSSVFLHRLDVIIDYEQSSLSLLTEVPTLWPQPTESGLPESHFRNHFPFSSIGILCSLSFPSSLALKCFCSPS